MANPNPQGNALPIQVRSMTPEQICEWAKTELNVMYLEPTIEVRDEASGQLQTVPMPKQVLLNMVSELWRLKHQQSQSDQTLAKLLVSTKGEPIPDQNVKIQALAMTRELTEMNHQSRLAPAAVQQKPVVVDFEVGLNKRKSNRVNKDGKMLYPDADPKLPEHLAFSDWASRGHEDTARQFEELGLSKTPMGLFGRVKPKGKRPFRHPQDTEWLYNQETNTFCPVTETLMQTKDSKRIPIPLKELPPGAIRVA
jgi:hypothetical protein